MSFQRSDKNFVNRIRIGQEVDGFPEFIADPRLSRRGQVVRESELGFYLTEDETGKKYTAFAKNVCPSEESIGTLQKLVIRNIVRDRNIVYLEPRVEIRDSVLLEAKGFAKDKGFLFSVWGGYDVYFPGTREAEGDLPKLEVRLGDHLGAIVYKIGRSHRYFKAIPVAKITSEEYKGHKNTIFRGS